MPVDLVVEAPMRWARWRAMGTDLSVIVVGGAPDATRWAVARIEELEARWSRFRPDSEVSRMNAAAGSTVAVGEDTQLLVSSAVDAWEATGGWFDPTVGHAVVAAGYDRPFDQLVAAGSDGVVDLGGGWTGTAPGCASVVVDAVAGEVTLPLGSRFDPGGIGKGLAADLVVAELLERGADGACVSCGGDVRAAGSGPEGDWAIGVADPVQPGRDLCHLRLACGGVATSSTLARRWRHDDADGVARTAHHLIDPLTGSSSVSDLVSATVIAADSVTAEAVATAAVVAGRLAADELCRRLDLAAVLIDVDGHVTTTGPVDRFLAPPPLPPRRTS